MRWVIAFAAAVLAIDVGVLERLGLSFLEQLSFAALIGVWTGVGTLVLQRGRGQFPDAFSFYSAATVTGMALGMAASFLGLQQGVIHALGVTPRFMSLTVTGLMLVPALAGARLAMRNRIRSPGIANSVPPSILFILASAVTFATAFGVENSDPADTLRARAEAGVPLMGASGLTGSSGFPNWGIPEDRAVHVGAYTNALDRRGVPLRVRYVSHQRVIKTTVGTSSGYPITLMSVAYLTGPYSRARAIAFSKALSLLCLFLVPVWIYTIARTVLDARQAAALLAATGALFYGALNVHIFRNPVSNYWACVASGSLYHNVTQQISLAVGLGGFVLVLLDFRQPRALFAPGCLLIALSALYKPSFFALAAPAVGLASLLFRAERISATYLRRDLVLGWACLALLPVFWLVYPKIVEIEPFAIPVAFDFFNVLGRRIRPRLLPFPPTNPLSLFLATLLIAYAPLVPVAIGRLLGSAVRNRSTPKSPGPFAGRPERVALLILISGGLFSAYFMTEPDRVHGNFLWGLSAAHFCMFPFMTRAIDNLENRGLRVAGWLLYASNLASGT